jgi:hypothetical protein
VPIITTTQLQVDALLEARARGLPRVRDELTRWQRFPQQLDALVSALDELREHPKTPQEIRPALYVAAAAELRTDAARVVDLLRVVEARYSRPTINVGVSGVARVGKSTLLQSLSGLADDQLPTGSGLPVTAVRSRIFHSSAVRRAALRMHTEQSFLDEVVLPFHTAVFPTMRPASLAEFREWKYVAPSGGEAPVAGEIENLTRLQGMQESLPSYAPYLVGGERVLDDVDELRSWVAYPSNDDINASSGPPPRRYLAVKDCRIDTPFPESEVEQLGICDLPGLGEIDPDADKRHVDGLRNEVDIVVLVKRPVQGMAYWGENDRKAMAILDEARGFVSLGDFVLIAVNAAETDDPDLTRGLDDDIRRQVNGGQAGRYHAVLRVDAASPDSVRTDLLLPLLRTLAARLPEMDGAVFRGAAEEASALAERVRAALTALEIALRDLQQLTVAPAEDLGRRAAELRKDLAVGLAAYVRELDARAHSTEDDPEFVEAVESSYRDVVAWIERGFDEGQEAWCTEAVRTMTADASSAPYTVDQLNRIRVEIGRRFGALDEFLTTRIDGMWARLSQILRERTADLLGGARDGRPALELLVGELIDAAEPCPAMRRAVEDVLDIRLEYRTQLYPRVRGDLGDLLTLDVRNTLTGERTPQISVKPDESGADQLYRFVTGRAHQAAHLIRKALLQEAVAPDQVVHAFVEQFDDALIRSAESERDFQRLARSYRDVIWPGAYDGIERNDARLVKVRRAAQAVSGGIGNPSSHAEVS